MSLFTGGGVRPPKSSKKFLQRVYSMASAVDSVCSRTAPGLCYGSTQHFTTCSCSSNKFAHDYDCRPS